MNFWPVSDGCAAKMSSVRRLTLGELGLCLRNLLLKNFFERGIRTMTHKDGGNGSWKFSPYLLDAQSGHKVKACYHKITINADDAFLLQQQGWSFDWSLTAE
jgi:hypothetical protein